MLAERSSRIGIVGAGASGLSAAHALRRLGYEEVVLLERRSRVGGKCCTLVHGGLPFDLGAVIISPACRNVLDLAAEAGAELEQFLEVPLVDLARGAERWRPRMDLKPVLGRLLSPVAERLLGRAFSRRRGLGRVPAGLLVSTRHWVETHGLMPVWSIAGPFFTACGYGYLEEDVPAALLAGVIEAFQIPDPEERRALPGRLRAPIGFRHGFQDIWQRLARRHDVRLGVAIRRITRDRVVVVETSAGDFEFDALILTCPLDEALGFLDASDEERRLFSRIRTLDYYATLCRADGFPLDAGIVAENLDLGKIGRPLMFWRKAADQPLTFYSRGDAKTGEEAVRRGVVDCVEGAGATFREELAFQRWRHAPHFEPRAAPELYPAVEALQGKRRTFYAGELLAGPLVELVVAYARDLVQRHFRP